MASSSKPASLLGLDPRNQFSGMTTSDAERYFSEYPGAAPGGTGDTGLAPNDSQGYSDLMNMQDAYLKATNPQTTVRPGQDLGLTGSAAPEDANGLPMSLVSLYKQRIVPPGGSY